MTTGLQYEPERIPTGPAGELPPDRSGQVPSGRKSDRQTESINNSSAPETRSPILASAADHCQFLHDRLAIALYKGVRGIRFDRAAAKKERQQCEEEIYRLQDAINQAAMVKGAGEGLINLWMLYNGTIGCLLSLAVEAFCKANPGEIKQVTVERWQPMRWNGKKWVKDGKLVTEAVPLNGYVSSIEEPPAPRELPYGWRKPVPKTVDKRVPITLDTWETASRFVKESCTTAFKRVRELAEEPRDLTEANQGELSSLLNCHVNIGSTSQDGDAIWLLYDCWQLPKQYIKINGRNTTKLTSDDDALLALYAKSEGKDERIKACLLLRQRLKELTYLRTGTDPDGRIRHLSNIVGAVTGRETVYASPTGNSCVQMQTVSKPHRHLWIADEGCELNQDDLKGADSWTVACHAANLGDPTMLNDLQARLKIQSIIALIYEHGDGINQLSHEELRALTKTAVNEDSWQYKACKRVLYMTLYLGGGSRMSQSILTDAWKTSGELVYVEPQVCKEIQQRAVFVRYPGVDKWHRWWAGRLERGEAVLQTAFGNRHVFHGRKTEIKQGRAVADHAMLKMALATEPQKNTGHCTQMAEWRMWNDPENRREDGSLRVEPLLTVHDSIISQNRVEDREWSLRKRQEWFNNPIAIAGQTVVIPVSLQSGSNWGMKG